MLKKMSIINLLQQKKKKKKMEQLLKLKLKEIMMPQL